MMKIYKLFILGGVVSLIMSITNVTYAEQNSTNEFFISNNTQEISVENAYLRLTGKAQDDLNKTTITVLQKNHIEPGKFANILGTYQMVSDQHVTGDNTEILQISPLQSLTHKQIFSLATELANKLQQESIAVFLPEKKVSIGDIVVSFTSRQPSITETIKLVRQKLPAYATAFSLHLSQTQLAFNNAKVTQIEWLGSKINLNDIKKAFPKENVSYYSGQAYLVYRNGKIEQL